MLWRSSAAIAACSRASAFSRLSGREKGGREGVVRCRDFTVLFANEKRLKRLCEARTRRRDLRAAAGERAPNLALAQEASLLVLLGAAAPAALAEHGPHRTRAPRARARKCRRGGSARSRLALRSCHATLVQLLSFRGKLKRSDVASFHYSHPRARRRRTLRSKPCKSVQRPTDSTTSPRMSRPSCSRTSGRTHDIASGSPR